MAASPPDNQELITTLGELKGFKRRIADLEAENAELKAAGTSDAEHAAALQAVITKLTDDNAALKTATTVTPSALPTEVTELKAQLAASTTVNANLILELNTIKAAINHVPTTAAPAAAPSASE